MFFLVLFIPFKFSFILLTLIAATFNALVNEKAEYVLQQRWIACLTRHELNDYCDNHNLDILTLQITLGVFCSLFY